MNTATPERTYQPNITELAQLPVSEITDFVESIEKDNHFYLSNGIPVYCVGAGKTDILRVELIFQAGSFYQPFPLVSNFTNKILKEGTIKKTGETLAEIFDFYGSALILNSERDVATVGFYCLEKHLSNLLPILEEIIKSPVFPEDEIAKYALRQKQEYEVNLQKVSYLASRRFNELLFGKDHPYGKTVAPEDFEFIRREHLVEFWNKYYPANNCLIIVSGGHQDFILSQLDEYFGGNDWNRQINSQQNAPALSSTSQKKELISKPDAVQSAIRAGKLMIQQSHPDYAILKVLNTILGGYFGSRLMKNIREDKGYTYGINSSLLSFKRSGCLVISSEVGTAYSALTVDEILKEIELLTKEPVELPELNLVKNYMLGSFLRSVDGPFDLGEIYKEKIVMGLDKDYFKNYIKTICEITPDILITKAKEYFDPSSFCSLIVGS